VRGLPERLSRRSSQTPVRGRSIPETYKIFPLFDPLLPSRQPATARFWIGVCRRLFGEPGAESQVLRAFAGSNGNSRDPHRSLTEYFRDADTYLDDLLRLVSEGPLFFPGLRLSCLGWPVSGG
jgi:hypothetical protein